MSVTSTPKLVEVVLRCRSCGVRANATDEHQQCESVQCRIRRDAPRVTFMQKPPWLGWDIARVTREEEQ